jgi:predicted membrane-bound dolichyl-phosphate-mannose-protein mannosyltransferase
VIHTFHPCPGDWSLWSLRFLAFPIRFGPGIFSSWENIILVGMILSILEAAYGKLPQTRRRQIRLKNKVSYTFFKF